MEVAMLQEKYKKAQAEGKIKNPREDILVFMGAGEGVLHFNTTRIIMLNTHEAQASIRIMSICTSLGEAAGTAAALAYNTGKNAHDVDTDILREKLVENGAILNA